MAFINQTSDNPDTTVALRDITNKEDAIEDVVEYSQLVQKIEDDWRRSKDARVSDENRWVEAFRNYRGLYAPDMMFTESEKSRVFVKITKTKVLAAYGQLVDVLFAGNKFPIAIEPSKIPVGVAEAVHIDPKAPPKDESAKEEPKAKPKPQQSIYGFEGDGREIAPGATLLDMLGPLAKELDTLALEEGFGKTPTAITYEPAVTAAERMEKKIHDQLGESDASKHLRYLAFEAALLGTGVMAGPFNILKESPKWTDEGTYEPEFRQIPKIEACSLWDIYPDPEALTIPDGEFVIRRRKYSRSQMRALKKRPFFRSESIEACIDAGANYMPEWWENNLRDNQSVSESNRWCVLEYWGYLDADLAEEAGLDIPPTLKDQEEIQVNAWICNGHILRLVMNPFTPARIPFLAVPYELNPYSPFGVGVAENMADSQLLLNGFMRMAVDNAVLSGNLIFEVDETNLVPGQDLKVFPGKIFRRQGGAPGQAIFSTKFQNVTESNMQVFDKARQLADEATGIPSYTHGQTGVAGTGRTAAGISMLMGASSTNIKSVIKAFDDYLLMPLGKSLFNWNMQFAFDKSLVGDLEVQARGTESLLKNEVRSQRLMTFLQLVSQPNLAPFAKMDYLVREIAKMMDLDPDKVCNDPREAQRQALIMQMSQGGAPQGEGPGAMPDLNAGQSTGTGAGISGVGNVPTPGMAGYSGPPEGGMG